MTHPLTLETTCQIYEYVVRQPLKHVYTYIVIPTTYSTLGTNIHYRSAIKTTRYKDQPTYY